MLRMGRSQKQEAPDNITPASPATIAESAPPNTQPPSTGVPTSNAANTERPAYAAAPATPRAFSETDALARDMREGVVGGFVGGNTSLTGEANFKGMLRVDGHLAGRINSEKGTLIVSSGGRVEADVMVAVAKINGTVNGNINATERLELGRTARVFGDIRTPTLLIEQGAIFEGACRMNAQAEAKQPPLRQASNTSTSLSNNNTDAMTKPQGAATNTPGRGQEFTPAASDAKPQPPPSPQPASAQEAQGAGTV